MNVRKMTDLDLSGQRVLIREDLNVPVKHGKVTSDARLRAALPTIQAARDAGAKVMLMSHLGRPTEGEPAEEFSLAPVAEHLGELLGRPVSLVKEYLDVALDLADGEVVLLENVRFNAGEKKDEETLARQYADLCDIFVMDAFGTAHRAQASTHGVARFAPVACAGPLLAAELAALEKALATPARPMTAIVGGSKVSTKLDVLNALSEKCDQLIVGGGIANTFIAAAGHNVGKSLHEADLIDQAKALMARVEIPLPTDVVVATEFSDAAEAVVKPVDQVSDDEMILDIGPVGVFEIGQFGHGTEVISRAIAESPAFSIAGGGDTLAAIDKYGIADRVSYISTGGGAFLEYVEGKTLPAVAALEAAAERA